MPILGRAGIGPVTSAASAAGVRPRSTTIITQNDATVTTPGILYPPEPATTFPTAFGTLTAKPSWHNVAAAAGALEQPAFTPTRTVTLLVGPGQDIFAAWLAYFGNRSGTAGTKQSGDRLVVPGSAMQYSDNLEIPPSANNIEVVFGEPGNQTILRSTQMSGGLVTNHAIRQYGTNIRLRGVNQNTPAVVETSGVAGRNGLNQQGNTCLLLDPGSTDTYVQDMIFRGARAAGFFAYTSTRYWLNRVTCEDSLADGFHNTQGSSYGLFTDCVSRRAGDDGFAFVYYDGNAISGQSHHMEAYRCITDTNGHGRGFANINCTDIIADQIIVRGTAAAGVIIDREASSGGTDHGSIDRVLYQRFFIEGANWSEQDHGSVFLRNGINNGVVQGVVMESFEIHDNPGHRQAIRTIGDGTTNCVLTVTMTDTRFTGGTSTVAGEQFGGNNTTRVTRNNQITTGTTSGVEGVLPTVVINTPGHNAQVTGVMTGSTTTTENMRNTQAIQFYAGDGGTKVSGTNVYDVQSVEIKVGDTVIGTVAGTALDVAKRGSQAWDTTTFQNGPARLAITATDKRGQTRTVTRDFSISNAVPGATPGMPSGGTVTPPEPVPTPAALLADTFTRTSTTTAGTADTGQIWQPTGTWGTDGSTLGSVSKSDGNWIGIDIGTVVQEFEAKQTAGGANAYPGLLMNIEGGGSWYRAEWDPNGVIGIQRAVSSAYTSLGTSAAGAMGVGKTIKMKTEIGANSTLVTVWVDGVQVLQGTDAWGASGRPQPTGTSVGFRHGAGATVDIRWDDVYANRSTTPVLSGVGTMSGTGSLTASGKPGLRGSAATSGAGTLVAGGGLSTRGTALLSGEGSLVSSGNGQVNGARPPMPTGKLLSLRADSVTGVSDGARITGWNDPTTSKQFGARSGGGNLPLFIASGAGGKPTIRFDGTSELQMVGNPAAKGQPVTLTMVAKPLNPGVGSDQILWQEGFEILLTDLSGGAWAAACGGFDYAKTAAGNLAQTVVYTFNGDSNTTIHVNGTLIFTGNLGNNGLLNSILLLGNHGTQNGRWGEFDISEIELYDHAFSTTERGVYNSYSQDRYGISTADYIPATQDLTGNALMSGEGTLAATGAVSSAQVVGAMSGEGTLAAVPSRITVGGSAALSGAGTLTATGSAQLRGAASTSGEGTLTATGRGGATGTAAMSGAGNLTASGKTAARGAGVFSGEGTLTPGPYVVRQLTLVQGPTDGPNAATWEILAETGPTGKPVSRLTGGPGPYGYGGSSAANLPGGTIAAGTRIILSWWARANVESGNTFVVQTDPYSENPGYGEDYVYPINTTWQLFRRTITLVRDWVPNLHRFRAQGRSVQGAQLDLSDVQVQTVQVTVGGSAGLSGEGTLAATGRPAVRGVVSLTGEGSLTAAGRLNARGTVALSSEGTLAATGGAFFSGAAAMSGEGSLLATGTPAARGAATLSGEGSLTSTGRPGLRGATALSGEGTLTVTGRLNARGAINLTGEGSLSAIGKPAFRVNVGLTGEGTLDGGGTASQIGAGSAELEGTGTLTATGTPALRGLAALSGEGSLSAVGRPAVSGVTAMSGAGTLVAGGAAGLRGTTAMSGTGTLTASGKPGLTGAAALSGVGSLTATGSPNGASSAALSGSGQLVGSGTPSLRGAGTLSGTGTLTAISRPGLTGAVAITGMGTLTATGQGLEVRTGGAAFLGTGTLVASGKVDLRGTAQLSGTGQLYGNGLIPGAVETWDGTRWLIKVAEGYDGERWTPLNTEFY